MSQKKELNRQNEFIDLLDAVSFDFSGCSQELKEFIYDEITQDRIPLGLFLRQARRNENDQKIIDENFEVMKKQIPPVLERLPFTKRMMIEPVINLLFKG